MEDFDLLAKFVAGSEDAFARLVERHLNAVYSVAMRTVHSHELAEEVTFSVFADLAKSAVKVKRTVPLIAWLFAVARRTALDVLKREQRRWARESRSVEGSQCDEPKGLPDEILGGLDGALERLKGSDREIILLRYFQEQEVSRIAESLGVSSETI